MSDTTKESRQDADWNVLTSPWLEVMNLNAEVQVCSPLDALNLASEIRCIAAASPLDFFAAQRFLLTLLYWKADAAGGVEKVRESLLRGEMPYVLLDAIRKEDGCFQLFDDKAPFLQEASQQIEKKKELKSVGYLFAEFACATNIAHFHHGDDKNMRVCLPCATVGMMRVVPWSQAGGSGLSPSVHNAPPIMAMASGKNLAITLGLNFVGLTGKAGEAKWTGHFVPTDKNTAIPFLEALTWNPRRVRLLSPQSDNLCWRCGKRGTVVVGPIVYLKNEDTVLIKKGGKTIPFAWPDPAAFYRAETPYTTIKSYDEELAAEGRDLAALLDPKSPPNSAVVTTNVDHPGWRLVIPCTNQANNKTFDHRQLELAELSADAIRAELPASPTASPLRSVDGWEEPRAGCSKGAARFVQTALRLLTNADWAVLSAAAYRELNDSPAAFDVLSGLLWPMRGKVVGLPSRNVGWLVLKLMAAVPSRARLPNSQARFCPLQLLPKRQLGQRRGDRSAQFEYPVAFPRGYRLEAGLRSAIDKHLRRRDPEPIDWAGLGYRLDQLID